ncbi:Phenylalanine--tRNA ligase beta subunit, cytoplasmic [Vitis vinifera]|uniref:Phenylalanine--tRNA ligase beta subunit, cytoplasmic n=1 Tax=Vitis vinifera TaxID=29760 RepID=A0A438C1G6_VITVI|nr:Phenylalanine--tRNA ligase beta subunit, cytoplasmic [Vitis vinifera]
MPCSVLSWCKESWHCALMHSILHRVLSWLRYCCISMLHPSNRPWHCAHDSSSCLTQGVAPLFPSLGGESASCPVSLRSWVAHQHLSWSPCVVPTRLAQCALLVSEALHQGPLGLSHGCKVPTHETLSGLSVWVVRTSLMPGALKTVAHNKDHPKPIKIFEVGDIAVLDEAKDVGATNRRQLAALYCGANSGFEVQYYCHTLVFMT